ncbi:hypothetical protein GCM10022199_07610 [Marihabitans asiaticum]|uniref:Uncharacterized protein DUF4307 n=1 Tax=Marihabitans asiaticum TaxID=415218 RepID=A0A560WD25_9MICO|nr:DUF4307 domain-containing protein [Marihabitans asiaticum]TWD15583.1 uncharacterized protein DUF4307 [Marihabitans asiaticum]
MSTAVEGQDGTTPRDTRSRWWVVGGVLVLAAVAMTVWFGISMTRGAVSSTDIGFELEERQVTMVFDVDRPVGSVITCHVKALDGQYATVGSRDVEIPASEQRSDRQRVTVRTTTQAVTATVERCREQ